MPRDCKEWYDLGIRKDGVYPVNPGNDDGFQVWYIILCWYVYVFINSLNH